jgi:hypothetical protein
MRKPSTGVVAVEIALRTAFNALSVKLIIARPSLLTIVEQWIGKTYAMSQFIDKAAISLTWLSPLRRVSDSRQGGCASAGTLASQIGERTRRRSVFQEFKRRH